MSKTTAALEALVAEVIANRAPEGEKQTARQRAATNRAFASILRVIQPRIRHFIRQYGLTAFWEDAEQVAAIAVHRAIEAYDPTKAQFTTFVNWQIRGEMQGLRFRLMTDQRSSAVKVKATTVSLQSLAQNADGEAYDVADIIEDEYALERVESGASDYLAHRAMEKLADEYIRNQRQQGIKQLQRNCKAAPGAKSNGARLKINAIDPAELEKLEEQLACKRSVISDRMFEMSAAPAQNEAASDMSRERMRQVCRHAARVMADIVEENKDFSVMREYHQPMMASPAPRAAAKPAIAEVVVERAPAAAMAMRPGSNVLDMASNRSLAVMPVRAMSGLSLPAIAGAKSSVTTLIAA